MIKAKREDGATVLEAEIPSGTAAFVDRDWLPAAPGCEAPALLIDADSISWRGTTGDRGGMSADEAAQAVFGRAAQAAAESASSEVSGPSLVWGAGAIAAAVARILGSTPAASLPPKDRSLAAAIDLSGDPEAVAALAGALHGLGRLVLAGERLDRKLPMNLYPDIHVRGISMTGIDPIAVGLEGEGDTLSSIPAPVSIDSGNAIPAGAQLLRFDG